jgi:hypothetical protein
MRTVRLPHSNNSSQPTATLSHLCRDKSSQLGGLPQASKNIQANPSIRHHKAQVIVRLQLIARITPPFPAHSFLSAQALLSPQCHGWEAGRDLKTWPILPPM